MSFADEERHLRMQFQLRQMANDIQLERVLVKRWNSIAFQDNIKQIRPGVSHWSVDVDVSRSASRHGHSGSGLPFVSGANGSTTKPSMKIEHIVTPA